MAYEWEGQTILAPLTFRSDQTVWSVEKMDKSIDRMTLPAQRWALEFSVTTNENEGDIFSKMIVGMDEVGTMMMPALNSAKARYINLPATNQIRTQRVLSAGTSTIYVKNTTTANVGVGKGTFIQFAGHNKVYAATGNKSIPSSSTETFIYIFPPLREAVANNEVVKFHDDVTLYYYLDDSMNQGITYTDGVLSGIDRVSVMEAL